MGQKKAKMSSTLLEVTRSAHEEVERLERLIVKELQSEPSSAKDSLFQSHHVRHMIDTISATTEKLVTTLFFDFRFLKLGKILSFLTRFLFLEIEIWVLFL